MKIAKLLTTSVLAYAVMNSPVYAQVDSTISDTEKKQIEKIVHQYLVQHPEVLVEASQALQAKQQQSMQAEAKAAIKTNADELFSEKISVSGNPKGNVTLVEFFDYQCIHCRKMKDIIQNLKTKNPDLKIIYKEFPIFGSVSELAAQAALAAGLQGKYNEMRMALLSTDQKLDENVIMDAAKSLKLDMEKLKADMKGKKVQDSLTQTRNLAEKMHLMGTPVFIIAPTPDGKLKENTESSFVPGGANEQAMQSLVDKARQDVK